MGEASWKSTRLRSDSARWRKRTCLPPLRYASRGGSKPRRRDLIDPLSPKVDPAARPPRRPVKPIHLTYLSCLLSITYRPLIAQDFSRENRRESSAWSTAAQFLVQLGTGLPGRLQKSTSSTAEFHLHGAGEAYARGRCAPCWKWYCRIRAASAGFRVEPFGSTLRTTSPRQTTSVADRPAISAGSTRLISSCALGCTIPSAWKSMPERLMFSVLPSCQFCSPS